MIGSRSTPISKQAMHVVADWTSTGQIGNEPMILPSSSATSTDLTMNIVNQAAAPILHVSLRISRSDETLVTYSMTSHWSRADSLVGFAALRGTLSPRPSSIEVSRSGDNRVSTHRHITEYVSGVFFSQERNTYCTLTKSHCHCTRV